MTNFLFVFFLAVAMANENPRFAKAKPHLGIFSSNSSSLNIVFYSCLNGTYNID